MSSVSVNVHHRTALRNVGVVDIRFSPTNMDVWSVNVPVCHLTVNTNVMRILEPVLKVCFSDIHVAINTMFVSDLNKFCIHN